MIESLINPEKVQEKPWVAFIAGFLFTITACVLTAQLGVEGSGTGYLVVAFITIAAAPFIVRIFDIEEKKCMDEKNIFDRHDEMIKIFAWFFLSVIIASSLFFVITEESASTFLFTDQTLDLCSKGLIVDPVCEKACESGQLSGYACEQQEQMSAKATDKITGMATATEGSFTPDFITILLNNLGVLALSIIFSFILGAGAIYLISWNATILGVLIAKIAEHPELYGAINFGSEHWFSNYLVALPVTLIRILPHGFFEFGGYFFGAVAGGILSMAIIKSRFDSFKKFEIRRSIKDAIIYAIIGIILIIIGSLIEIIV